MATISELADAALRVKARSAQHVGMPLAAKKAINGKGIFADADVKRLTRKVMSELGSRKSRTKGSCL